MTEIKGQYKLYELSDRLTEIEECLELLEGTDVPADLHQDYLDSKRICSATSTRSSERTFSI